MHTGCHPCRQYRNHRQYGVATVTVLHTHSRRLDYHPHAHVALPGGGVDNAGRQWKKKKIKFLFNEFTLAKMLPARFLEGLTKAGLSVPCAVPRRGVGHCACAGKGISALKYLSRCLYRGVIAESNIVSIEDGNITFKYVESLTGKTIHRTLKGHDFLRLVLHMSCLKALGG